MKGLPNSISWQASGCCSCNSPHINSQKLIKTISPHKPQFAKTNLNLQSNKTPICVFLVSILMHFYKKQVNSHPGRKNYPNHLNTFSSSFATIEPWRINIMRRINLRIAELRKTKGFTQQEVADAVGVSCQTVSK